MNDARETVTEHDARNAVRTLLRFIGEDPNREGLNDTPKRVVDSYAELFRGYGQDPKRILERSFQKGSYDQMILLEGIEFQSTCEHHMLPFIGVVHIAYVPGADKVLGVSKLARAVEIYARRLQIQERLTQEIADAINSTTPCLGVAVMIEAKHFCMVCRGVGKQATMKTSALCGVFKTNPSARKEFFDLVAGRK